jgi:hypothetical protein
VKNCSTFAKFLPNPQKALLQPINANEIQIDFSNMKIKISIAQLLSHVSHYFGGNNTLPLIFEMSPCFLQTVHFQAATSGEATV